MLCCILKLHTVISTLSSYSSLDWVLSHPVYFTVHRFICIYVFVFCVFLSTAYVLCYRNTVRWTWWDWSLILRTYLPSFLWCRWLGHLTRKNSSPIWPIRWDVKPCSSSVTWWRMLIWAQHWLCIYGVHRYGCGNSVHLKCMKVWAEHQLRSTGQGPIECPFCRENFGPLAALQAELRGATRTMIRRPEHPGVVCHECHVTPIVGKCYRWVDLIITST